MEVNLVGLNLPRFWYSFKGLLHKIKLFGKVKLENGEKNVC